MVQVDSFDPLKEFQIRSYPLGKLGAWSKTVVRELAGSALKFLISKFLRAARGVRDDCDSILTTAFALDRQATFTELHRPIVKVAFHLRRRSCLRCQCEQPLLPVLNVCFRYLLILLLGIQGMKDVRKLMGYRLVDDGLHVLMQIEGLDAQNSDAVCFAADHHQVGGG